MANNNDNAIRPINIKYKESDTIDEYLALTQPVGSIDQAVGNNLYGINHNKVKGIVPDNKDSKGYVFFTRPQLNLSSINLAKSRLTQSLLTKNAMSVQRYVRCMLDPRLGIGNEIEPRIDCPLVDNNLAFIPVLSNTLNSLSGWPDIVVPTFTSKQGVRKEQYTQVDGSTDIYESFDIDCNFRNIKDEPTLLMMQLWTFYQSAVFEDIMSPYLDFILEREIDYNTRIYRLIMDPTDTYVKKIAATGASFPVNVPSGKVFDYGSEAKFMSNNKEINIRFKCVGAMYNDTILIKEFNDTTITFNRELEDIVNNGFKANSKYEKVPKNLKSQLNHRGYPLINYETFELEWWVSKSSTTWKNLIKRANNTSDLNLA